MFTPTAPTMNTQLHHLHNYLMLAHLDIDMLWCLCKSISHLAGETVTLINYSGVAHNYIHHLINTSKK